MKRLEGQMSNSKPDKLGLHTNMTRIQIQRIFRQIEHHIEGYFWSVIRALIEYILVSIVRASGTRSCIERKFELTQSAKQHHCTLVGPMPQGSFTSAWSYLRRVETRIWAATTYVLYIQTPNHNRSNSLHMEDLQKHQRDCRIRLRVHFRRNNHYLVERGDIFLSVLAPLAMAVLESSFSLSPFSRHIYAGNGMPLRRGLIPGKLHHRVPIDLADLHPGQWRSEMDLGRRILRCLVELRSSLNDPVWKRPRGWMKSSSSLIDLAWVLRSWLEYIAHLVGLRSKSRPSLFEQSSSQLIWTGAEQEKTLAQVWQQWLEEELRRKKGGRGPLCQPVWTDLEERTSSKKTTFARVVRNNTTRQSVCSLEVLLLGFWLGREKITYMFVFRVEEKGKQKENVDASPLHLGKLGSLEGSKRHVSCLIRFTETRYTPTIHLN